MGTADEPRNSLESILVLGSADSQESEKLKRSLSESVFKDAGREIDIAYFKDGRNFFKGATSRLRKADEQKLDAKLLFVVPIDSPDVDKVLSLYTADDPKYSRLREVPLVVVGNFDGASPSVQHKVLSVGEKAKGATSYDDVGSTVRSLKVFEPTKQKPLDENQFDDDEVTGVHTPIPKPEGKPETAADHSLPVAVIEPSQPSRILRPDVTGQYVMEPRTRRALVYSQNKAVEQQFTRHLRKQEGDGGIILPGFKVYFATDGTGARMSIGNAWLSQEYRNSVLNWLTSDGQFDQTFLLAPETTSRVENLAGIVNLLDSSEKIPSTKISAVIPTTMYIPDFQKLGEADLARKVKLYPSMDALVSEMQHDARRQIEAAAKRGSMIDIADELVFPHETFLIAGDKTRLDVAGTQPGESSPIVVSRPAAIVPPAPEPARQTAISAEYTIIGDASSPRIEGGESAAKAVVVEPQAKSLREDEVVFSIEPEVEPAEPPEEGDAELTLSQADLIPVISPVHVKVVEPRKRLPTPPPAPVEVIAVRPTRPTGPTPPPTPKEALALAGRNGSESTSVAAGQPQRLMLPERTADRDDACLEGIVQQELWISKVDGIIRTKISEPIPGAVHEVVRSVVGKYNEEDALRVAGAVGSALSSLKDAAADAKVSYIGLLGVMGQPSVSLPSANDLINVLTLYLPDFVKGSKTLPYGYWDKIARRAVTDIDGGGLEILNDGPKRLLEVPESYRKDYISMLEELAASDLPNAMAATTEIFKTMGSLGPDGVKSLYLSGVNHLEYNMSSGLSALTGKDGARMVESAKGIQNMLAGVTADDSRDMERLLHKYDSTSKDALRVAVLYALQAINRSPTDDISAQRNFFELLGMLGHNEGLSPDTIKEKIISLPLIVAHPQMNYADVKGFVRPGMAQLSKGGQDVIDKGVHFVMNAPAFVRLPLSEIIAGVVNSEMSSQSGDIRRAIDVAESLQELEKSMEGTHVKDRYIAAVREKAEKVGFSADRVKTLGKDAYYHLLFEEIMLGFGNDFRSANKDKYSVLPNKFLNGERVAVKKAILEGAEAMLKDSPPEYSRIEMERYLGLLALVKIKQGTEQDAGRAVKLVSRLAELTKSTTELGYYEEMHDVLALSLAGLDKGGERVIYEWPNLMPLKSANSTTRMFNPAIIGLLAGLCRECLPQAFDTMQLVVGKSQALQDETRKNIYLSALDIICLAEKPSVSGVLGSAEEIFKRVYSLSEDDVEGINRLLSNYDEPERNGVHFPIVKAFAEITSDDARRNYLTAVRILGSEPSVLPSPEDASFMLEYLREVLAGKASVKYDEIEGLVRPALLSSANGVGMSLLKGGEDIASHYGKEHPLNLILSKLASEDPTKAVRITSEVIAAAGRLEDAANEPEYFKDILRECSARGRYSWSENDVLSASEMIVHKHNWFITKGNAENYARLSRRFNEDGRTQLFESMSEGVAVFCPDEKSSEPDMKAARDKYLKLVGVIADNKRIPADDVFRLLKETLPGMLSGRGGDYSKMHATVESLLKEYHDGGDALLNEWVPLVNAYGDGCKDKLFEIIEGIAFSSKPSDALSAARKIIYNVSQVNEEENRKAYLSDIIASCREHWDTQIVLRVADTELAKYKFFESEPESPDKVLPPLQQPAGLLPAALPPTDVNNQIHVSGGSNMTDPNNVQSPSGGTVAQPVAATQPTSSDSPGAQAAPSAVAGVIIQPVQQPAGTGQPAPSVNVSVNFPPGTVPPGTAAAPAPNNSGAYQAQPVSPAQQPDPDQTTLILDKPKKNRMGLALTLLGVTALAAGGAYFAYRVIKADDWQAAADKRYDTELNNFGNLPQEVRKGLKDKYKVEWSSWNTQGDVDSLRKEADAYNRYAGLFGKDKAIQSFKRGDSIDSVVKQLEEENSRRSSVASAGTKPDAGQAASSRPAYAATQPAEQPASQPAATPASRTTAQAGAPTRPRRQYTERKIEYDSDSGKKEAGKKPKASPSGKKGHRRWVVRSPAYDAAEEANTPSLDQYVIPASRLRQESETPYNRGRSGNRGGIY